MARKKYTDVREMVQDLSSDDPAFLKTFDDQVRAHEIIGKLMVQRAARGLSQGDLAARLNCSQSRVSKLESLADAEIRLGDLKAYADAIGLQVYVLMEPKDLMITEQVKRYAFRIKALMDRLAELAKKDESIARAVRDFFIEATFNIMRMLKISADKCPTAADSPRLGIVFEFIDDRPAEEDEAVAADHSITSGSTSELAPC